MIKIVFTLLAISVAPLSYARVVAPYTDCAAAVKDGKLELEPLPANRFFAVVLDQFSVEKRARLPEAPEVFVLAGRVVDDNAGLPIEGVAIAVHLPGQGARLVAISNTEGEFRISAWLESANPGTFDGLEAAQDFRLRLPSLAEGDLLLGGSFDSDRRLVSGIVSRYSLADLTASTKAPPRAE